MNVFSQWRFLIGSSWQGWPPWEPLGHRARGRDAAAAGAARDPPLPREGQERSRGRNSTWRQREVPQDTQNEVSSVPRPCAAGKGWELGKERGCGVAWREKLHSHYPRTTHPCAKSAERSRKGMEIGKRAWMWGVLQGKAPFPLSKDTPGYGDVADLRDPTKPF